METDPKWCAVSRLKAIEKGGTEVVKTDILRSLLTTPANCTELHWNC